MSGSSKSSVTRSSPRRSLGQERGPGAADYGLVVRGASPHGLTDTQLRASACPGLGHVLPGDAARLRHLLAGHAADLGRRAAAPRRGLDRATLALIKAKTDNLDVLLSTRTKPADVQAVSGTFFQATQPVSIAGTVAVSATQLPAALGQGTMAQGMKVTLASDQSTLPAVSEIRAATLHVTATGR
jgi:hypothetical protein